jgi:hypothetical protein
MIVLVDANVIVADPNLRSDTWDQLTKARARGRARVFMPEIVLEEAVAIRGRALRSLGKKLVHEAAYAPSAVFELVKQAQSAARSIADGYEDTLRGRWTELGFELATTSNAAHLEVARRAIARRRPFDDQGGGYRDTLHWLTLIDLAARSPREEFVLLTNDGIFATKQNVLLSELSAEFSAVNAGTIALCRALGDLMVPGHFSTDPVEATEYEPSLRTELIALLNSEYVLQQIYSPGLGVPFSDWDEIVAVRHLNFETITSREIQQQTQPELRFSATASFTIRGTYIHDVESGSPELSTKELDMAVKVTGNATTLDATSVGNLRDVHAAPIGDDPLLEEAISIAGRPGLDPVRRMELESNFGSAAVVRVEDNYHRAQD